MSGSSGVASGTASSSRARPAIASRVAAADLAEARMDIAAHGRDLEIGAECPELRLAADRAGGDARAPRQLGERARSGRHERVAWIGPRQHGGDDEAFRQARLEILQR